MLTDKHIHQTPLVITVRQSLVEFIVRSMNDNQINKWPRLQRMTLTYWPLTTSHYVSALLIVHASWRQLTGHYDVTLILIISRHTLKYHRILYVWNLQLECCRLKPPYMTYIYVICMSYVHEIWLICYMTMCIYVMCMWCMFIYIPYKVLNDDSIHYSIFYEVCIYCIYITSCNCCLNHVPCTVYNVLYTMYIIRCTLYTSYD